ncbi:glycosyltransferase family 4 protein [Polynucleobacter sp. UB-Raua-W9]|nr:glycosyltransferase family 4 protein [Polynucleobacter sp. UB-Raua-W9]
MLRVSMLHLLASPHANLSQIDHYEDLLRPDFGERVSAINVDKKTINWFIPPISRGSGGHLNIFRFIRNLEELGYENHIVIVGNPQPKSVDIARKNIHDWFFPLEAKVYIGNESQIPAAFFAIATEWRTAYFVKRYLSCVCKCYFVQDFEPYFYPTGTNYILAENTYRFGFYGFTAGSWLADKLTRDYGMNAASLGFSYDRDLYSLAVNEPDSEGERLAQRVFFYARPPTARRAFELGVLVLREVQRQKPNITIVLAGWDLRGYKIPFRYENSGLVELDKLGNLYRSCDVALVLSFSNLSLLPLELMACGVPVVSNKAPYTEWLLNEDNSVLAEPNVEALAGAVLSVLNDKKLSDRIKSNGLNFCKNTSWKCEAEKLASGLNKLAN